MDSGLEVRGFPALRIKQPVFEIISASRFQEGEMLLKEYWYDVLKRVFVDFSP